MHFGKINYDPLSQLWYCALLLLLLLSCFSRVRLCATPWTTAYHAPPSLGFSRQEYWSGVPLPSPILCLFPCKWITFLLWNIALCILDLFPGQILVLWFFFFLSFLFPQNCHSILDNLFLLVHFIEKSDFFLEKRTAWGFSLLLYHTYMNP